MKRGTCIVLIGRIFFGSLYGHLGVAPAALRFFFVRLGFLGGKRCLPSWEVGTLFGNRELSRRRLFLGGLVACIGV